MQDVLRESIMYEEECGEDRTVATEQQRSATYFSNSSDRERSTTEVSNIPHIIIIIIILIIVHSLFTVA